MAEPRVEYCTSRDGTTIAYMDHLGEPPPIIMAAHSLIPNETTLRLSDSSRSLATLGGDRRYVRFDRRGIGYSQRDVKDLTKERQVEDLAAVTGRMAVAEFDLVGLGDGCMVAATFAARHPEGVRRLALVLPWTETADQARGLSALIRSNWPLGRRAIVDVAHGDRELSAERRRERVAILREMVSPEVAAHYTEMAGGWLPGAELRSISVPTTVFAGSARHERMLSARALVSAIPGARLDILRSEGMRAAATFLAGKASTDISTEDATPHGETTIIVFADIADSTALTERMGDTAFRAKARDLDTALRERVRANGGAVIDAKTLGDGILATFPAASQAIAAALSFKSAAADVGLGLHVGLHAGDVIRERDNVFGGAVNIAARISALAEPGEVLVSDIVRGLARTSAGVTFEDRGEQALRGVGEPQRVFAVLARDGA